MRALRPLAAAAAAILLALSGCGPAIDADPTTSLSPPATTEEPTTTVTTDPTGATAAPPAFDTIGRSILGRPLLATTFGSGPQRMYVVGSIHGDERTAAETSRLLLDRIRASLPAGVTVRWLVDANPDGTAAGTRDNAAGIDLNRNWPTGHEPSPFHGDAPLSEPETEAVAADIAEFSPTVVVAMHSAREGPFVDHDGPGAGLAHAFAAGASGTRAWEVVTDVAWSTPGSLGTHFGFGVGIPVITVEGSRWDTPAATLAEMEAGLEGLARAMGSDTPPVTASECSDHALGDACTSLTRDATAILQDAGASETTFLVKDAGGVVLAARRADWPLYPASSIKTLHLVTLLAGAAGSIDEAFRTDVPLPVDGCRPGATSGSEPLGALVERMMIDSDNAATNAIQAHLGLGALNEMAERMGMEDTALHHGFGCGGPANDPANVSTVADLTRLYDHAISGDLLDPATASRLLDEMLDITSAASTGTDGRLAAVRVVAKEGWYGDARTIAGVALAGDRTLVFAVHAHGIDDSLDQIVGRILVEALAPAGD